jgi:monoamine oxidase
VPIEELADLERAWVQVAQAVERIDPSRRLAEQGLDDLDVPLSRFVESLGVGAATHDLLAGVLGEQVSGDWNAASALGLLQSIAVGGGIADFLLASTFAAELQDGTASLVDAIVADGRFEVTLGAPVRGVEQSNGRVRVRTDDRDLGAETLICAAPLNTIGQIDWRPALEPARAAAVRIGHVGAGHKSWALARGVRDGLIAYGPGPEVQMVAAEGRVDDEVLLVCFGAEPIDAGDPAAVQAALRPLLPEAEVTRSCGHDWNGDPWARGTWAAAAVGSAAAIEAYPGAEGRVSFASGDVGAPWSGYIDGAIHAGRAAAARVLARDAER